MPTTGHCSCSKAYRYWHHGCMRSHAMKWTSAILALGIGVAPAAAPVAASESVPAGPVPTAPGPPLTDTFTGPFWRVEAPAGGSASISGSHLFLGVPAGANHDPLRARNQAV